ncbi:hypothetical protein LCGC14_2020490 [marine sediment metagenome]|uniref:Uncharacterized protein n=1 Tax=marine sediment metagenome TaxID=412755 RepID=A0A0F9EXY4_9ZZZZ
MDTEEIKQLANDVNNVMLVTAKPLQEHIKQLQAEVGRLREDEKAISRIWGILGVKCYADAKGMEISEIVGHLKAENEQAIKFLNEALPYITCENHYQSGLITAIGTFVQTLSKGGGQSHKD